MSCVRAKTGIVAVKYDSLLHHQSTESVMNNGRTMLLPSVFAIRLINKPMVLYGMPCTGQWSIEVE